MNKNSAQALDQLNSLYFDFPEIPLSIDLSRMRLPEKYLESMDKSMKRVFEAMAKLEAGEIANQDENRAVGHYWLRNSSLAPKAEYKLAIDETLKQLQSFAARVHSGEITGQAGRFQNLILIGIGGSALGPQFVAQACGNPLSDRIQLFYLDNTDPEGMDLVLRGKLKGKLGVTLCLVISKSGGTKETRNGMVEAQRAFTEAGIPFAGHFVAITQKDSKLDQTATKEGWLARFPMWDWVGGRTSETSAVGLLPALLQGIDIHSFVNGASEMDRLTRKAVIAENPAALLAISWFYAVEGRGTKAMVVLPYKDRLDLFAKYLQQLIMESLGKELDREGKPVHQGITVYGNKGSTDQHSYIQQLRDGVNNFFVTFVEVLKQRDGDSPVQDRSATTGDYLMGYLLGTRKALYGNNRTSLTITIDEVTPKTVGGLIALYERAVGFYAELVGINAYHQPGVEAGKKAAEDLLDLQHKVLQKLASNRSKSFSPTELADELQAEALVEDIFKLCQHLAANPARGVKSVGSRTPSGSRFQAA